MTRWGRYFIIYNSAQRKEQMIYEEVHLHREEAIDIAKNKANDTVREYAYWHLPKCRDCRSLVEEVKNTLSDSSHNESKFFE